MGSSNQYLYQSLQAKKCPTVAVSPSGVQILLDSLDIYFQKHPAGEGSDTSDVHGKSGKTTKKYRKVLVDQGSSCNIVSIVSFSYWQLWSLGFPHLHDDVAASQHAQELPIFWGDSTAWASPFLVMINTCGIDLNHQMGVVPLGLPHDHFIEATGNWNPMKSRSFDRLEACTLYDCRADQGRGRAAGQPCWEERRRISNANNFLCHEKLGLPSTTGSYAGYERNWLNRSKNG